VVDNKKNSRNAGKPIDTGSTTFKEFMESVRVDGLLTPITVRPLPRSKGEPETFELVAGYRRMAAMKKLGKTEIMIVPVESSDDYDASVKNLIENVQRENVSTYDQAAAFAKIKKQHKVSGSELARRISRNVGYVNNLIRAQEKCAPDVLNAWRVDESVYHIALTLAAIDDHEKQLKHPDWLAYLKQPIDDETGGGGGGGGGEGGAGDGNKKMSKKKLEELLVTLESKHPTTKEWLGMEIKVISGAWVPVNDDESRQLLRTLVRAVLGMYPREGRNWLRVEELEVEEEESE
jgi:ParB/RepB/Spo0J family partition protein